ncbi:unnamed protein product [Moneuplotes crassus]|uniref:Uncharacterized protein n=1 Tax=Euplotes crassus TaxID=5936 RepID=A0AAD2D6A5_EUPCR|nr:unnamed protein product [Moneuplotes crassus]
MRTKSLESQEVGAKEEVVETMINLTHFVQNLLSPVNILWNTLKCQTESWVDQEASFTDQEQLVSFHKNQKDKIKQLSIDLDQMSREFQKQASIKIENVRSYFSEKGYMTDDISNQIDEIDSMVDELAKAYSLSLFLL